MRSIVVLLVALGLVLASCGTTATPGFSLEFRRTGGLAGVDDRLAIDQQGNATLTRSGQTSQLALGAETVGQLQDLLDQAGFDQLNAEYLPSGQGADLYEYAITYRERTVRTADTAIPGALQPLIDVLNRIVDTGQP
jgi:hypothetical protein